MVRPGGRDSDFVEIVHELRNAATSVGLAVHYLSQSDEIASSAAKARLRIAHREVETMRRLLNELDGFAP